MDEGEPVDMIALHRQALEAKSELTSLAQLYLLALKAREYPASIMPEEVERLAEGILKHVKPYIGKRGNRYPSENGGYLSFSWRLYDHIGLATDRWIKMDALYF